MKSRTKSSYNYGRTGKHGVKKRSANITKGAFGKPKLEAWQLPDDPRAANLPKCNICGLPTSRQDRFGRPQCEFCAEDYKRLKGNPFVRKHKEIEDEDDE